jgi:hypothetical protein
MPLDAGLIAAYEKAEYWVGDLVMRIGQADPRLDALLDGKSAAFITAANPHSQRRPAHENRAAHEALIEALKKSGVRYLRAEGRDPNQEFPPEPGVLALGIARDAAGALGRAFGQNAIVYVERGKPPELVLLA